MVKVGTICYLYVQEQPLGEGEGTEGRRFKVGEEQ